MRQAFDGIKKTPGRTHRACPALAFLGRLGVFEDHGGALSGTCDMIEASATRNPSIPWTRRG
jgi:hypothetical protein